MLSSLTSSFWISQRKRKEKKDIIITFYSEEAKCMKPLIFPLHYSQVYFCSQLSMNEFSSANAEQSTR